MTISADQARKLLVCREWDTHPFFRFWMPYCFERAEHPRYKHVFLPLNRDYQPLGHYERAGDYHGPESVERYGVVFRRDPATFKGIWWTLHGHGGEKLWLYDDTIESKVGYFDRLGLLLGRGVDVTGKRR